MQSRKRAGVRLDRCSCTRVHATKTGLDAWTAARLLCPRRHVTSGWTSEEVRACAAIARPGRSDDGRLAALGRLTLRSFWVLHVCDASSTV